MEKGHGRIEWRGIEVQEATPTQMNFPHVAQVARVDRWRTHKNGKQEVETVWVITSRTVAQTDAAQLLALVRQYWCIENGLHYRLDVSAGEDRCSVQQAGAATVLGLVRRAVQGEYRAWAVQQKRARDRTYPTFKEKLSRRIRLIVKYVTGAASQLQF